MHPGGRQTSRSSHIDGKDPQFARTRCQRSSLGGGPRAKRSARRQEDRSAADRCTPARTNALRSRPVRPQERGSVIFEPSGLTVLSPPDGRQEDAIRPEDNQSLECSLLICGGSFGPTPIRQDGAPTRRTALVDEGARRLLLGVSKGPSATAVNLGHDSPPPANALDSLDKAIRIWAANPAVDWHNPLVHVEASKPQLGPHLPRQTRLQ